MKKLKKNLTIFLVPILSILLAFLVGIIIMAALGTNPWVGLRALFRGALGTVAAIGTTLNKSTPLIFTGLCACFAYKCGIFNLGGEGQFLIGATAAFCAVHCSGATGIVGILLALVVGAVVGGLWGLLPGILKITRGLNEMIITIMLNYGATLFMGVIYTNWIRDVKMPQTPPIHESLMLPRIFPNMRFTWSIVIALVIGIVLYYFLYHTSSGFKLRAVGINMTASRFNGFPVNRYILITFIISGAIAGLGGAADLMGTQYRLINGYGNGYGFDGVAGEV